MPKTRRGKILMAMAAIVALAALRWCSQEIGLASDVRVCASHIRRVGLVTLAYTEDHGDRLPSIDPERAIAPYAAQFGVTANDACPVALRRRETSYSVNPRLIGRDLRGLRDDSMVVLVYEGFAGEISLRHNGGAYYYYADGHLEWQPRRTPLYVPHDFRDPLTTGIRP